MKLIRIGLVVLVIVGMVLFVSPVAYADEPIAGESNIAIDIRVTGTTQVHVTASDGSHLDVGAQGATDTHLHFIANAYTIFNIYITGDGEADIDISGPCEVNVKVEGSSEVYIDAGDEVELNVEASDESQVFIDDEKANDEPSEESKPNAEASNESQVFIDDEKVNDAPDDLNPDIEASDPHQALVSDQNVNGAPGDNHTSRLNSMAIISGAFLAVGLPILFLIRRKAKRAEVKCQPFENIKEKGEEVKK